MLFLTKIYIKHFKHLNNIEIELDYPLNHKKHDQPLEKICLVGPNGVGKSSISELLENIMNYPLDPVEFFSHEQEQHFKRGQYWYEYTDYDQGKIYQYKKLSLEDVHYAVTDIDGAPIFQMSKYEFKEEKPTRIIKPVETQLVFKNFRHFERMSIDEDIFDNILTEEINAVLKGSDSMIRFSGNPIEFVNNRAISEIIQNTKHKKLIHIRDIIYKYLKKPLFPFYTKNNPQKKLVLNYLTHTTYSIQHLSAGEQIILQNIFNIEHELTDDKHAYQIIYLNEFENSLHPYNQVKLFQIHKQYFGPGRLFIYETHSPFIASFFEPWEIVNLKYNTEGQSYRNILHTSDDRDIHTYIQTHRMSFEELSEFLFVTDTYYPNDEDFMRKFYDYVLCLQKLVFKFQCLSEGVILDRLQTPTQGTENEGLTSLNAEEQEELHNCYKEYMTLKQDLQIEERFPNWRLEVYSRMKASTKTYEEDTEADS